LRSLERQSHPGPSVVYEWTVLALLAGVAAAVASPAPPVVIGRSTQGRPITARRIGDPSSPRKVIVVGAIHGDEGAGRAIVRRLAADAAAPSSDIWLVSTVNPDGSLRASRTNARGVDLNRNFSRGWRANAASRGDYAGPRPFSEPEARAVRALVLRLRPRLTIWFHQPWGQVLAPCHGAAAIQRRYARIAGLPVQRCRGSTLPGTATRWQMHALQGSRAFVVELGPGRLTAAAVRRHARAVRAVAR
jgi:protein MpaA